MTLGGDSAALAWRALVGLFERHGSGVEVSRYSDGTYCVYVGFACGQGDTLEAAVADAVRQQSA